MRTTRRALCAVSIALASILALSCDNSYGIFSSVQDERAQTGTKVFQKTQVTNAFRLVSNYYAATATLQKRDVAAGSGWGKVAIVGGTYTLRSAVLAGTTIYALIETGGTVAAYSSPDGAAWTAVALPAQTYTGTTTFTFDALFATSNGQVYAEGHAYTATSSTTGNSTYTLYPYDGVSAFGPGTVATFAPALNKTIRGVVYDGAKYWFASEDLLRSGTANSATIDEATAFTGLAAKSIWGISYVGTFVYITTKDGAIYQNGTAAGTALSSVPLTCVAQVPGSSGSILLVGSDAIDSTAAVGYYEGAWGGLAIGSTNTQVALNSSIFSTTVSTFPVHAFYFDSLANKVFICVSPGTSSTKSYGLYSSDWNGSSWSGWAAE
jgi:hypothetical protein